MDGVPVIAARNRAAVVRSLAVACVLVLAGIDSKPVRAEALHLGPLVDTFPLTLSQGERTEIAGPFWAREKSEDGTLTRLSPLVSHVSQPDIDRTEWDFVYPLATYDRFGSEYRWQFLQLLSFSGGRNLDGDDKRRVTIFPFYFSQRSSNPTNDYAALLPVYGRLRNRLFRDEVRFFAAPLWLQTRKRDVVTDNFMLPFFHIRHGDHVKGWQLLPIYGHEVRQPSIRTNLADLPELVPGHDRRFFAWPFFFNHREGIGGTNEAHTLALLPLYQQMRSPERDNTLWLWPFFTHTVDRRRQFSEWGVPYPFVGWSTGPGKHGVRIWPVYGRMANSNVVQEFAAWPLYTHKHSRASNYERERTRSVFYAFDDLKESNPATGAFRQRRSLWPFFIWRHELDGRERLQVLAPVESVLPNNKTIERLHSPIWSIYRSESHPKNGTESQSLLWNLWRRDVDAGGSHVKFMFGAFQMRSTPDGHKRFGVFHTPSSEHVR